MHYRKKNVLKNSTLILHKNMNYIIYNIFSHIYIYIYIYIYQVIKEATKN